MKQPVDKIEFWKGRIERVAREKKPENYSVYISHKSQWEGIAAVHKALIRKHCAGKVVLDAGCGYGRVSEWVDNYTGIDFSPDFIALARVKYPTGNFMVADLLDLSHFNDHNFDVAVVISIKQMIIDNLGPHVWDKMEKELRRVAKEVLILEYIDPEKFELLQ